MMGSNRPLNIPGRRTIITKKMIEDAQANTKSNMAAARWLGRSYNNYKKWAKYFGLFDQHANPSGKGIRKGWAGYTVKLEDIFSGKKNPHYAVGTFKSRLINEGWMTEECHHCGYNELNLKTEKVCLNLDYIDGDNENKQFENLRLLCPNCYLSFNGWFHSAKTFCK